MQYEANINVFKCYLKTDHSLLAKECEVQDSMWLMELIKYVLMNFSFWWVLLYWRTFHMMPLTSLVPTVSNSLSAMRRLANLLPYFLMNERNSGAVSLIIFCARNIVFNFLTEIRHWEVLVFVAFLATYSCNPYGHNIFRSSRHLNSSLDQDRISNLALLSIKSSLDWWASLLLCVWVVGIWDKLY